MKKIKKVFKNNYKILIGLILGIIISVGGVYAAVTITGSNVTYSNTTSGLSSTTVQDAIDELNTKANTKITEAEAKCPTGMACFWAKVGDYISMTPTATSYTITTTMTGYTSSQTIYPNELNLWRVIALNSDGTMDLVSEYVSSTNVYLKGKTGYQRLITTLNQIASQYTNSKYTTAARHMGYNGQTGIISNTSSISSTTAPWTSSTSSSTSTSNEAKGGGDMNYEKDYNLVKNALGTSVAIKYRSTTATTYYLASREYYYASSTGWGFRNRNVSSSGTTGGGSYFLYYYNGSSFSEYSVNAAIRPIITIKSGITKPSGTGTSVSPYVLS